MPPRITPILAKDASTLIVLETSAPKASESLFITATEAPKARTRALEALGVFYVLDQMKMYMAMQESGGMLPLLEKWFSGRIAEDIMMSPDVASRILGRLIKEKLMVGAKLPQLDILVSHDFTLFTIKNHLLGQTIDQYPAVDYLDGIAFFIKDQKIFAQSHHEPAKEINLDLPYLLS